MVIASEHFKKFSFLSKIIFYRQKIGTKLGKSCTSRYNMNRKTISDILDKKKLVKQEYLHFREIKIKISITNSLIKRNLIFFISIN